MNESKIGKKLQERLNIVYLHIRKMGASKEDAEDIIQDTAYKFLLYIDSVDIKNIDGWLFRVGINQYYDMARKHSRRKGILLKFNHHQLFEETTPETITMQQEFDGEVHLVLNKLKQKYRELLILKYSLGLTTKDIAELYNTNEGIIKTNLYRARKQFIKEYRRYEDE